MRQDWNVPSSTRKMYNEMTVSIQGPAIYDATEHYRSVTGMLPVTLRKINLTGVMFGDEVAVR